MFVGVVLRFIKNFSVVALDLPAFAEVVGRFKSERIFASEVPVDLLDRQ